jgi:hypothetical protein
MDPDIGVGIGSETPTGAPSRPRPTVFVRGLEIVGLALVVYGLGAHRFAIAAIGGAMIVGSYALYRRKHGSAQPDGSGSDPWGSDADGGGD